MNLNELYDFLWEQLNRLDVEVRCAKNGSERNYFTGQHMAYMNILGMLWPESAGLRIADLIDREETKTKN